MSGLVKDIISEQKFMIQQLEHYITGGARLIKEVCHGVICGTRGCLGRHPYKINPVDSQTCLGICARQA
jgi:hypothetical protein